MICLGIDPGLDGAMVWIDQHSGEVLGQQLFADLGREWWHPDQVLLYLQDRDWQQPGRIALEMVSIRSAQRGQRDAAIRWGVLWSALCYAYPSARSWTPRAAEWMKAMHKDQPGGTTKERSVALCCSELPTLDLTPGRRRKPHTGLADAGGLALWAGRRRPR